MSHFTVCIIGDNPEEQLAPFQENNMGDCPQEYLEFENMEPEYREKYMTGTIKMVRCPDGKLEHTSDAKFNVKDNPESVFSSSKFILPDGYTTVEVSFSRVYKTFSQFMKDYAGYETKDEKTGKYGLWRNPQSKWDWYSLGGRWRGYFKLKKSKVGLIGEPGVGENEPTYNADQALKKDIDFKTMRQTCAKHARDEYQTVLRLLGVGGSLQPLQWSWKTILENEKFNSLTMDEKRNMYRGQVPLKRLEELRNSESFKAMSEQEKDIFGFFFDYEDYLCSEQEYVQRACDGAICTHAVIKDGQWYEKGEMGWWGCVSHEMTDDDWNRKFSELLDNLPSNTLLSIYDCHI